jgi:homocitrate synthase
MDDARIAVETGVDGVDVVIGTSSFLREHSHGKDMDYIHNAAIEVINFVKSKNIEVRFSSEDSFRSDLVDLLSIYRTVDKIGVNRVGIADTVFPWWKTLTLGWLCESKAGIRSREDTSRCCILRH